MINSMRSWFTSTTSAGGVNEKDKESSLQTVGTTKAIVSAGTSDGSKPPASKGVSLADAIKAIGTFYLFQVAGATQTPSATYTDALMPTPPPRQWSASDFVRELYRHGEVATVITSDVRSKDWWEEYAKEFMPLPDPCGPAGQLLSGLAQSADTGREVSLYDYEFFQDVPQAFNLSHEAFGSQCDGYSSLLENLPHLVTYKLGGPDTVPPLLPQGTSPSSSPPLYLAQHFYNHVSLDIAADNLIQRGHIVWSLPIDGGGTLIAAMPGTREAFKVVDRLQQAGAFTPRNPLPPRPGPEPEPEPKPTDTPSAEPFELEDLTQFVIVGTTIFLVSRALCTQPAPMVEVQEEAEEAPPQEPAGAAQEPAGPAQVGAPDGADAPGDVELVPLLAHDSPEPPAAPTDHDPVQNMV